MSDPKPLRVDNVTRHFGTLPAVDGLTLEVHAGEILGFLGPNGAGKTTTLRICSGLVRADAGDVFVSGKSISREPLEARARFGLVPDRPFLYERLTAREFLEFVAALYELEPDVAMPRAEALIERLALTEQADDLIETYSLGMRQKVAVAAAMLHEPALLMLDEPLAGLDPRASRALKDLLREHAERGAGVLVSTHLLDVAERLCDRVAILHHGRKVSEGSFAELREGRGNATLEDVFLELTQETGDGPA
jgi:ABC-2 type transport system ATP-binding protein